MPWVGPRGTWILQHVVILACVAYNHAHKLVQSRKVVFYFIWSIRFNYDLIYVFYCQCCYDHRRFLFSLSITNVSLPLQMWLRVVLHEDCFFLLYAAFFVLFCSDENDLVECVQSCVQIACCQPPPVPPTQYPYTHTHMNHVMHGVMPCILKPMLEKG